jgi:hypothetical protein
MFSLKIGIFIPKGWGILEESFVSDLQQLLPTYPQKSHRGFIANKIFLDYSENIMRRSVYSLVQERACVLLVDLLLLPS